MSEKENVTLEELKTLSDTSEKLARDIRMISRSIKKMVRSGLKKETIVILVHDYSNVGKTDIRAVLAALENLEKEYTLSEEKK